MSQSRIAVNVRVTENNSKLYSVRNILTCVRVVMKLRLRWMASYKASTMESLALQVIITLLLIIITTTTATNNNNNHDNIYDAMIMHQ